jgi:glycosyltransferase involved in cell wall biosynthesis
VSTPPVSILLTTYNHGDFIDEALASAVEQDYPELTVVVADDCSTDNTAEIVRRYERAFPSRVKALVDEPHVGILGNYNRGLAACAGKYVAFLDGDDQLLEGKIARQVEWMEADDRRTLCGHDVEVFDSESGRCLYLLSERTPLRSGEGPASVIRHGVPFAGLAIMVRRDSLPRGGYDSRLRMVIDWKLWIDCLSGGGAYGWVPGVFGRYRQHPGGVMAQSRVDPEARRTRLVDNLTTLALVETDYPEYLREARRMRAVLFYEQGVWHFRRGDAQRARKYFSASLREWPAVSWKVAAGLAASVIPVKRAVG